MWSPGMNVPLSVPVLPFSNSFCALAANPLQLAAAAARSALPVTVLNRRTPPASAGIIPNSAIRAAHSALLTFGICGGSDSVARQSARARRPGGEHPYGILSRERSFGFTEWSGGARSGRS
jgi:hypothetical protein